MSHDPASRVRLVVSDVDGVLTDGTIGIDGTGVEFQQFSVLDGLGVQLLLRSGITVAFLSSRASEPARCRGEKLGVQYCLTGVRDKKPRLLELTREVGVSLEEVSYLGDDLVDIACLQAVGFPVAVANARDEVKDVAKMVTAAEGGRGAFRETAEHILRARGLWDRVLESYR